MATNNTCSMCSECLDLPPEPCALPSFTSDEDSFVVLWNDKGNNSFVEINHEPIGTTVVEEAKELINKELSEMDSSCSVNDNKSKPLVDLTVDGSSKEKEENGVENLDTSKSISLPEMPEMKDGQNYNNSSDVISMATISTELTSEQMQAKISEIVDENIRLKDTILHNNMSMKSQFERIEAWQKDVQKVHRVHKDKIKEAKECIDNLKKEKALLISELDQLKTDRVIHEEELRCLKQMLQNKEKIVKEAPVSEPMTNHAKTELEAANEELKKVQSELGILRIKKNELEKIATEREEELQQQKKMINALQLQLQATGYKLEEVQSDIANGKYAKNDEIASLQEKVENLQAQLLIARNQQMSPTVEEVGKIRQQLASTQIMLTYAEQSRNEAFEQMKQLEGQVEELKTKLSEAQSYKDEIYALKAQLDVYKTDFEEEKGVKETFKTEKDKLMEDLQNLQRRNQQLQEEIDLLRENEYVIPPSQSRQHPSTSSTRPSAPPTSSEHSMRCPVCNFKFKTHQALEAHVYKCIELEERLP